MFCLGFEPINLYLIQNLTVKSDPTVLKIRVQHGKKKVVADIYNCEENYTVPLADCNLSAFLGETTTVKLKCTHLQTTVPGISRHQT